jgi:hypothetical protein
MRTMLGYCSALRHDVPAGDVPAGLVRDLHLLADLLGEVVGGRDPAREPDPDDEARLEDANHHWVRNPVMDDEVDGVMSDEEDVLSFKDCVCGCLDGTPLRGQSCEPLLMEAGARHHLLLALTQAIDSSVEEVLRSPIVPPSAADRPPRPGDPPREVVTADAQPDAEDEVETVEADLLPAEAAQPGQEESGLGAASVARPPPRDET